MNNKVKMLGFMVIIIFSFLILSINTSRIFQEVREFEQLQKNEKMKITANELKLQEVKEVYNQSTDEGWSVIPYYEIEETFTNWLLEEEIILSQNSTLNSGRKEIEFKNDIHMVWREFIPFLNYLINYFQEPRLQINNTEIENRLNANVKFSYLPNKENKILLNKKLLTDFQKSSVKNSFPVLNEKLTISDGDPNYYARDIEPESEINDFPKKEPIQPLPDYIEILGYISNGDNSFFLLKIADNKILLDTFTGEEKQKIIVDEKEYRLKYGDELFFLRGRD